MALPIISADERLAQRKGIKGCIFGRSGIGKTSLLWTLNASTTLFMDLEAGDLAVEGWDGDTLRPRTWKECRDFAVFIGGPNPALREAGRRRWVYRASQRRPGRGPRRRFPGTNPPAHGR
jgi:hypothetical protein